MKKTKEQGITLIALVVTIIVLLILAGVTIALVLGQNGIFNKAQIAADRTNEGQELDQVRLSVLEAKTNYITGDKTKPLKDELQDSANKVYPGAVVTDNGDGTYTITLPNMHTYIVDSNGNVTRGEDATEIPIAVTEVWYKVDGLTVHLSNSDLGDYTKYNNTASMENHIFTDWFAEIMQNNSGVQSGDIKIILDNKLAPTNTTLWFYSVGSVSSIVNNEQVPNSLVNLNTSNVTDMSGMFMACTLSDIDVIEFDTSQVKNMNSMFVECDSLTSLNLSNWNTEKVRDMGIMFCGSDSLTDLNLSNWNTSSVTNMSSMFEKCSNLANVTVSQGIWTLSEEECGYEGTFNRI